MDGTEPAEGLTDLNSIRRRIIDLRRRVASSTNPADMPRDRESWVSRQTFSIQYEPSHASGTGGSHLHRHRLRRQREDDTLGTVQDAVDRLNEATSDLSSILDEPLPQIISSQEFAQGLISNPENNGRRHKRRKLDGDPLDHEAAPIYGHYGQVVPGRLKMSILNCDGGHLSERDDVSLHRHYCPENILRNDKSVYCTEKSQCNIILRHWKETPFSLTKLIIKTPDVGFTAPVQEGLIFVAMSSENLLRRTARYQILASPQRVVPENNREYPVDHSASPRPSFLPVIYGSNRPPSRRPPFVTAQPNSALESTNEQSLQYDNETWGLDDPDEDRTPPPDDVYPQHLTHAPQTIMTPAPEFDITSTCDDPSGDEEDPSSPAILFDRQRRRNFGAEFTSSEEDTDSSMRRHRRLRSSPRSIEIRPKMRAPVNDDLNNVLLPHAAFFIDRKKNVVSVKFDPPATGRYILIKLWSPQDRENIDIQSVSVYGYAGTRFVPALRPR